MRVRTGLLKAIQRWIHPPERPSSTIISEMMRTENGDFDPHFFSIPHPMHTGMVGTIRGAMKGTRIGIRGTDLLYIREYIGMEEIGIRHTGISPLMRTMVTEVDIMISEVLHTEIRVNLVE